MAPITDISQLDLDQSYSYADYLTWRFTEYVELIRGKVLRKMAAPTKVHQQVSRNLTARLFNALEGQPCELFAAPFDVRLLKTGGNGDAQIRTVVQPDLCVVCDASKLDDKGCLGAPDLVIEIISPRTARLDTTVKAALYAENGVREYWVVFPGEQIINLYELRGEEYKLAEIYAEPGPINSLALPGLRVDWNAIFGSLIRS